HGSPGSPREGVERATVVGAQPVPPGVRNQRMVRAVRAPLLMVRRLPTGTQLHLPPPHPARRDTGAAVPAVPPRRQRRRGALRSVGRGSRPSTIHTAAARCPMTVFTGSLDVSYALRPEVYQGRAPDGQLYLLGRHTGQTVGPDRPMTRALLRLLADTGGTATQLATRLRQRGDSGQWLPHGSIEGFLQFLGAR